MLSSAARVAERFLIAKGGVSLRPEYETALKALEDGDPKPIREFGEKVQDIILPGGGNVPPDWFHALGIAKRNALKSLYRDIGSSSAYLSHTNNPQMLAYSVGRIREWAKALRTLELASVVGDADREIKHGPFIIIPVPGVSQAQQNASIAALDEASSKIRAKFPQVLYGKVFLATHLSRKVAAHYVIADDTVHLSVNAAKRVGDIYTICHEFGHRYDRKFLDKALRTRFWALSTRREYEILKFDAKLREQVADEVVFLGKQQAMGKPIPKMSYELVAWLRSADGPQDIKRLMTDFLNYKVTEAQLHDAAKGKKDADVMTDKVLRGPIAVTPYGGKNPTENFAEAFAHYVLGMNLAPEISEVMAELR